MSCLVTGAAGFVGAAVVRALLAAGETVRVIVRASSARDNLQGLDVEVLTGDLRDSQSLTAAVKGCRWVFHVAADYRLWAPRPQELYANNVDASLALIDAAVAAGVERVIYTSSVATLKLGQAGTIADEDAVAVLSDMVGHYKRSKFLAEAAVLERVRSWGAPVVIVSPSTPVGPGDIKPTPTGRLVRDASFGRIPAYVDTGLNIVHVDDVAEGHLLAARHGTLGRRYILGGENLTLKAILASIAAHTGQRPPWLRLPREPLYPLALLTETWARLTGGPEPRLTLDGLRMSRKHMWFSSARAERELGYRHRSADVALGSAVAWFRAQQRPDGR